MIATTPQGDYRDLNRKMTLDTQEATAKEIAVRHAESELIQKDTIDHISSLLDHRRGTSRLVEMMYRGMGAARFFAWWREANLPVGWAARYMRIAKTAERKALCDKSQLRLIGVIAEAEPYEEQQNKRPENLFLWVNQVGKIRMAINEEKVNRMSPLERTLAIRHLEPIVEVYEALKALSK